MKPLFLLTFFFDPIFLSPPHPSQYSDYNNKNYSAYAYHRSYFYHYGNEPRHDRPSYHPSNDDDGPYYVQNDEPSYEPNYEPSYEPSRDLDKPIPYQEDHLQKKYQRSYEVQNHEPYTDDQWQHRRDSSVAETRSGKQRRAEFPKSANNVKSSQCNFQICEASDYYPEDAVKNIFKNNRVYDGFFKTIRPEVTSRDPFPFENMCDAVVNITFPKTAINLQDKKRFVVNYDRYAQGIKIETCKEPNKPCLVSKALPPSIDTQCEQRFTTTPLLALDDEMELIVDTFSIPSCCVCMYKEV